MDDLKFGTGELFDGYFWLYPSLDDPTRLTLQCSSGGYEDCGDFDLSRDEAAQLRDWLTNWLDTFPKG